MRDIIKKLIDECNEYYDTSSEYGIGYLDALQEVCQHANIKHNRTEWNLILEDV